jgi:hypothetical protein
VVGKSFQNNRFDYVWPIKVLRWYSTIFFQVLDVMSFTLFLMTLDCNYFSTDLARYYNLEFPQVCESNDPNDVPQTSRELPLLQTAGLLLTLSMLLWELCPSSPL